MPVSTLPVCPDHGRSACRCHPEATHRHFRSRGMRWVEFAGHTHNILIGSDERSTYCTHDGCDYAGRFDPNPATIQRAR